MEKKYERRKGFQAEGSAGSKAHRCGDYGVRDSWSVLERAGMSVTGTQSMCGVRQIMLDG